MSSSISISSISFFEAMRGCANPAHTENGALSLSTTQPLSSSSNASENKEEKGKSVGGRLDLFFKSVRGMDDNLLDTLMEKSWAEDPLDTLRIVFHTRDCRKGKGERVLFYKMMGWMCDHCSGAAY